MPCSCTGLVAQYWTQTAQVHCNYCVLRPTQPPTLSRPKISDSLIYIYYEIVHEVQQAAPINTHKTKYQLQRLKEKKNCRHHDVHIKSKMNVTSSSFSRGIYKELNLMPKSSFNSSITVAYSLLQPHPIGHTLFHIHTVSLAMEVLVLMSVYVEWFAIILQQDISYWQFKLTTVSTSVWELVDLGALWLLAAVTFL